MTSIPFQFPSKQINYFDLSSFILTLVAHLSEKKEERRIFRLLIKEKLSRVNTSGSFRQATPGYVSFHSKKKR